MNEIHAESLDFMRTSIGSKQGVKVGANEIKEELQGDINQSKASLNQHATPGKKV